VDGGAQAFLQQRLEGPQLSKGHGPSASGTLVFDAAHQG
jgi:hypothetical protein